MFRKILFPLIILQFIISQVFSQVSVKDSAIFVPMFYFNYSYQFPQGGTGPKVWGKLCHWGRVYDKNKIKLAVFC